ncbi:TetR/AcrR family transcriptional regulator [soil metagenome]
MDAARRRNKGPQVESPAVPIRAAKALAPADGDSPRSPRSRTKGAERAKQIVEVAEQLFNDRGYSETSMDDIARAAGILKGSLYYYMDSKEDLLFKIVSDVHTDVHAILEDVCGRADLPPLERVAAFVEAQVVYNTQHVTRISVYHHEWQHLDGERLTEIRMRRRQAENMMVELLQEAQEVGSVAEDIDPKLAAFSIFAVVIWPYTWYRPGSIAPTRLAKFSSDFVMRALGHMPQS